MDIKVGDPVIIVQTYVYDDYSISNGKSGFLCEIEESDDDGRPYKVRFTDGDYEWAHKVALLNRSTIPSSAFREAMSGISFAEVQAIFGVLQTHGVNVDWNK